MRALALASLLILSTACDDGEPVLDASTLDASTLDAGSPDAASPADAGVDAAADAGVDAGGPDAGPADAGIDGGPVCEASPCRLVAPQCGCPSGQRCTIDDSAAAYCAPDGTAVEGESCASDECAAGFVCAEGPELSTCLRFCETDADCPSSPGSKCLYDFGGPKACTVGCDPVEDTGCQPEAGCTVKLTSLEGGVAFTDCRPAGAGVAGEPCASEEDCQGGHLCVEVEGVRQCVKWCESLFDCPADQLCQTSSGFSIGARVFGYCE